MYICIYRQSRRQRVVTGSNGSPLGPSEATGGNRGQFPRTDCSLRQGI